MTYRYLLMFIIILAGCRSTEITPSEPTAAPAYSIVYIIHGDANYLYHNAGGEALQADEQVLKDAKQAGLNAKNGEVFIFHQKPEDKILWLFPKKDRRFLHYRNGKLVGEQRYSPQSDSSAFVREAALYNQNAEDNAQEKIFLYFGHEIPVHPNRGYHFSRSQVPFNTEIFANGVQSFLQRGKTTFDLTILSTCNNGTPSMVHALTPHTRYILASPQNLHLSHIDTKELSAMLEQRKNINQIAIALAENTYHRLKSFLQTAITLSVYDTRETSSYLPSFAKRYKNHLKSLSEQELLKVNSDCTGLSFFSVPDNKAGVSVWYKAARFGQKNKSHDSDYSGWGCKK